MADAPSKTVKVVPAREAEIPKREPLIYDRWAESQGVPIYHSFAIEDVAEVPLGWWEERGCNAAIIQLVGQEGLSEAQLIEIPPGQTLTASRKAIDEIAFVIEGRGLASVWAEGLEKKSFEWADNSLFILPSNHYSQLSNAQGDHPARLLLFNNLPIAMTVAGNAGSFFKTSYVDTDLLYGGAGTSFYAQAAKATDAESDISRYVWRGNFFPDLKMWDQLENQAYRGGGQRVTLFFSSPANWGHVSTFPPGTYKKAHKHGAGVVITVLDGEGYSLLWPEKGGDMVMARWKRGSLIVPPDQWYHQHFNVGSTPARYLGLHGPVQGLPGRGEYAPAENQIEYCDENPQIRQLFEEELGSRGTRSLMPDEAYRDRDFVFTFPT